MRSLVRFADLDLRAAFDFAIMIEEDAQARYEELSRRLGDDPGGAGEIFRSMVAVEGKHRDDLVSRRAALFRDAPPRIEISVAGEGVERPDVDDDDLPTTARQALEVALAAERRAYAFYGEVIPGVKDPAVRAFFEQLRKEEAQHAAVLEGRIAARGDEAPVEVPIPAGAGGASPVPPETFPDRALLEDALPQFDAATQAVAVGVIVEGMGKGEVAAALGVSRRTVARKLGAFLAIARQRAAVAVAAAALTGGVVALPRAEAMTPPVEPQVCLAQETSAPPPAAPARAPEVAPRLEDGDLHARILGQVAKRMRTKDPAVHARVARAILAEATRAGVDPLLVLALIHVESSFDPHAVSSAGAIGLMQLLEPTMRREMERSQLPVADPRDPVANVQAGVRYLRRLLSAFEDVDVALMAYNAGPNRIRGYLRSGGIPERFHVYPRRIKGELERLRVALGRAGGTLIATNEERPRPRG